jgi:hypothetical protein
MNFCKYWDCGWCYAPAGVKVNANLGECIYPEHCPYLKSQNQMTNEIDISRVLIDGDTATIMGVRYQRIIEPQSFYDKLYGLLKPNLDERVDFHNMTIRVLDLIRENIPEYKKGVGLPEYSVGYNDGIREVNENLFK